ncbi:hypothetical protein JL722_7532 [Aureococcus anophagefferens]|nr:hypothetical protein JL722_7532 [Aureococcus anophagefferens]
MYGLRVGADMYESNKLTGAIDELYVYTSALDREAISVLYGSVTASPTVTPAPSTYYFEGTLRAYYSFDEGNATDATGAYSGDTYKNGHARNLGPTESRDDARFDGEVYAVLPDALTYEALTGDEERTICLWARIDDWDGGFLFEYGSDSADGASFGLAVGDAESNVTLALSGSYQTVVTIYGNTSYIDWDDWHHYCLTYDGSDVVLYFDGLAEATAPASLDTETMYGLRVGADMYESNKLTGAIDELYVYTSALDREAISVLYGSVTASPTVTPAPSTYYFEGTLRAYYSFDEGNATDATGAYSGDTYKNGHARNLGPTESRDGGDALGFDGEVYAVLPDALTYEALTGDEERTICLWARIDDWDGGFLRVRSDSADGASLGLAVGDAESNVTLALSGSYQTVVTIYGNTSYIDWDDWHHYCLTYDGSDIVLYFDGLAEATAPASLDTETMYGLRVGADMYESNKLTGAIDELYVYTSALDREAISVLYGSVTASPTVTPAPSTYYFEGTLRAYYSFDEGNATDATGAYSGDTYKNGHARNLGPTESRDGGDALGFDGEVYAVLPDALTYEALTGDEERTICLWARIDDWDGGFLRTVVTIYGNTSYIDWDDWHHYCLTYDGSDVVLYFDGLAEATAPASLDTETMYGLRVGADMYESNKLTGAIDELYVYTSALDREAISVLYGSVTASPTVTPAPSTYYFEGTLRAYYSFDEGNATDATGAYSGDTYKNGHARNLGPTESRDGGTRGFDGEVYAVLPDALTYEALTGDEERTICLWARIDDWDGGFLRVRSDSADGASFGLAVGDAESNVTLALSGSYQTVVTIYGNTSYIDWDDWHHYCLTYDGSDVTMYGLRVGADMYESNKLTGAIDELYVYTSALDREAISVLYGSVTASPTVTPAPSTYYFEGTLRAYYSFDEGNATDATGAYSGDTYKNGHARNLGPTESRDGGDALGFDGEVYAVLPDALTYEALTGDEERTICLWARIDDWDGGFLRTVVTIYGNTSYIDWDDWHHYCLTYDGSDVVLYFDGLAEATAPASLDTETMYGLRVGADMYESNKLTGAIDELYVYTSALDREAISVLYGSVTASPTVTPAPSTYYFEGTLRAYYSFDEGNATDATGAYSGDTYKNGHARNLGPTESRDGGDALGFDGEVYAVLPDALTYEALTGDEERTICLWARIDDWDGGFLFEYGSDSADGASFGLAVGDAESNVTLALSGSYQTVVTIYGNTSYIDWDDWHHYCLTYDGSDVVLYFDGLAEATAPASLDTETMYGLRVGADMYESNKLTGAIDELYVYTSALDREAISVLYGSVTASRR